MDRSVEYVDITMYRLELSGIPTFTLPADYSFRTFEPGDERHWVDIEMRAGEFWTVERGFEAFDRDFRPAIERLPGRMFFLVHQADGPVGTATAWRGTYDGRTIGQLHWVAIVPEHQGKGLAKPLVSTVLRRIAEEHSEAFLTTQTWSWRAVGLYRAFWFETVIAEPDSVRAMDIVNRKLLASGR